MKVLDFLLFTVLLCGVVFAQENKSTVDEQENEVEEDGTMRLMYKILMDCSRKPDISVCLKVKAVKFLDRALMLKTPLPLMDYVALARDASADEDRSSNDVTAPLSEDELEGSLPRSLEEKSDRLDTMIFDKVDALLRSRSLQLTLPSDVFEGRKKGGGKYGGMMLAGGAAMAGMMMQMALGKIALIAGKALMVAKVALVLSAVIGLKKLLSGGGGGGDSHPQVVYASGDHGGGGWSHRRSLDSDPLEDAAHEMAYSAHVNKIADTN